MTRLIIIALEAALWLANVTADTNYRLNSNVLPLHYSIAIVPYLNTGDDLAFTFDGEVSIQLYTNETGVNTIRLHSVDLELNATNIVLANEATIIGLNLEDPLEFNSTYDFVDINLMDNLEPTVIYTLSISYRGPIRKDLYGFYRSSYVENGEVKWLGATQMESTHARKVFPCFDEPQYKATFSLTIDRPSSYKPSVSNTKIDSSLELTNGYVRDVFLPTPVMSTYLLAFLVSEYEPAEQNVNGTKEFGVYTRPEAKNQSDYAFQFGLKVVDALSAYFGIDYYSTNDNLKLDHVALPDFNAGAMENWGLVKYRESLILYVPEESTPYYKYRVAQIVAHETTHMWFGNLVTCHWWSNTWLNEGFANYFQDYITAQVEPEVGSANMLVIGSVYAAYNADEIPSAPAITNDNVNSPAEISGHFGTISYQKAGSVIRMIHHLIGDDAFRFGLNAYLNQRRFDVGYPENMYSALTEGVQSTSSLADYPDVTLTEVMQSWISQPGHPVLEVSVDYTQGEVSLTQKRFYKNGSYESDELYMIPITYTTGIGSDFENTKPAFIMTEKTHVLNVTELKNHTWILFNVQETGVYRVNYDTHSWHHIGSGLKQDSIHQLNKAKIVNDLFAFYNADVLEFELVHEILDFLKTNDDEYSVWYAAVTGLNALRNTFMGTNVLDYIENYALELLENIVQKLGYEERTEDSFETLRNRMQVLEFACNLGHKECIESAVALFRSYRENGTKISPSLRPVAYCNGLRYGNGEDYEFLWQEMLRTNVANEALVIENALGCTNVEDKLKEYLETVTKEDTPIRFQDITIPLTSILSNHSNHRLVLFYLKNNYTLLSNAYPSMESVMSYVTAALHTEADLDEFEEWIVNCEECSTGVKTAGLSGLSNARAVANWANGHVEELRQTFNAAKVTTPCLFVLIITFLLTLFRSL